MTSGEPHHDRRKLAHRMARLEGHTRAVIEMINDDRDCAEVLHQIRSIVGAWQHLAMHILDEHLKSCVKDAIISGRADEAIENLRQALIGKPLF